MVYKKIIDCLGEEFSIELDALKRLSTPIDLFVFQATKEIQATNDGVKSVDTSFRCK